MSAGCRARLPLYPLCLERPQREVVPRVVAHLEAEPTSQRRVYSSGSAVPGRTRFAARRTSPRGEAGMPLGKVHQDPDGRSWGRPFRPSEAELAVRRVVECDDDGRVALRQVERAGDQLGGPHGPVAVPPERRARPGTPGSGRRCPRPSAAGGTSAPATPSSFGASPLTIPAGAVRSVNAGGSRRPRAPPTYR